MNRDGCYNLILNWRFAMRIRPHGPAGSHRPFTPAITNDEEERRGDALDHIAVSLAAIDHNLEALAESVKKISEMLPTLLSKR